MMGSGPQPRAAVVDDDRLTRLLVRKTLEAAGYDVVEADTGAAGLRLALARPDVMVLDLQLPDMSGLAVCNAIYADTAVVMLTADGDNRTAEAALRSGAWDCVPKPVSPTVLSERVEAVVKARAENSPPRGFRASPGEKRGIDDHEERVGLLNVDVKKR